MDPRTGSLGLWWLLLERTFEYFEGRLPVSGQVQLTYLGCLTEPQVACMAKKDTNKYIYNSRRGLIQLSSWHQTRWPPRSRGFAEPDCPREARDDVSGSCLSAEASWSPPVLTRTVVRDLFELAHASRCICCMKFVLSIGAVSIPEVVRERCSFASRFHVAVRALFIAHTRLERCATTQFRTVNFCIIPVELHLTCQRSVLPTNDGCR